MRLIFLVILTFVFCLDVWAKTDFRAGFVVNSQNDTIQGYVKYKEGDFNYCLFKRSLEGEETSYSPESILGFGYLEDKYFESKKIKTKGELEKVFTEVLVRGKVSLYRYRGRYFVEKINDKFYELEVTEEIKTIDNKRVKQTSTKHLGILHVLLNDCPEISAKIDQVKLFQKPMTRLIEDYNQCVSSDYISYKALKPWTKVSLGVLAGYSFSTLSYNNQDPTISYPFMDIDLKSNQIFGGGFINLISPRINERFSFQQEVWYQQYSFVGYTENVGTAYTRRNDVVFDFSSISLPTSLKFTLPGAKLNPFLYFGVTNYFLFNRSGNTIMEEEYLPMHTVSTFEYPTLEINKYQVAIHGGVGMEFLLNKNKAIFIDARYENGKGQIREISNPNDYLATKSTFISILLGLKF